MLNNPNPSITPTRFTNTLLSNEEAAEYLGVSPLTLEVWRSTKRYPIQYVKVGRKVKYKREALDAFLESRTIGA